MSALLLGGDSLLLYDIATLADFVGDPRQLNRRVRLDNAQEVLLQKSVKQRGQV